jgi:hypothetical protein
MIGVKKKQIDIRVRKKPTAPESAQCDKGELQWTLLVWANDFFPEMNTNLFYQRRTL